MSADGAGGSPEKVNSGPPAGMLLVVVFVAVALSVGAVVFVVGGGDQVERTPPEAGSWETGYYLDGGSGQNETADRLLIQHMGGDSVDADRVSLTANNESLSETDVSLPGEEIGVGDTIRVDNGGNGEDDFGPGDRVELIYAPEYKGGIVLDRFVIPEADSG